MTTPAPPLPAPLAVGALTTDPQTGQLVGNPGVLSTSPDIIGTVGSGFQPAPQLLPAPYLLNPTSNQPAPPPPKPHHAGGLLGFIEHVGHDAMGALNWGLGDVQHLYRYFHDVIVRHGWAAGLGELALAAGVGVGAGMLTGGIADAALGGLLGEGAAEGGLAAGATSAVARFTASRATKLAVGKLAAAGAGTLAARMTYTDSWNRTADGATYYAPKWDPAQGKFVKTSQHVSFGRDLGDLIAGITGIKQAHSLSGLADAFYDFSFTPAYNVAKVAQAARAGEFGARAASGVGVTNLTRAWLSTRASLYPELSAGDLTAKALLDVAQRNPRVLQMADWIARKPGETPDQMIARVTSALPYLSKMHVTLLQNLTKAEDGQGVLAVFARAINNSDASFNRYGVPTVTLTRNALGNPGLTRSAVADAILNKAVATRATETSSIDGGPSKVLTRFGAIANTLTSYTPWTLDPATRKMSNRAFDPMSSDAPRLVRQIFRHSMSPQDANAIAARYALADLGERRTIYKNAVLNAFRADGVPETSELFQRFQNMLNDFEGTAGRYAGDGFGAAITGKDAAGNPVNQGLFVNQQGRLLIPDFEEWRQAVIDGPKDLRKLRDSGWSMEKLAEKYGTTPETIGADLRLGKGAIARSALSGDQWLYDHITTRLFKRLVLLSFGFASRVSASELIPAALHLTPKHVANSLGTQFMGRWGSWGEWLDKLPTDESDPLVGLRVRLGSSSARTPLGTIVASEKAGTGRSVTVRLPDGEETAHRLSDLTVYHRDITDAQIRKAADELGIRIDRDMVPHVRAAAGYAMFRLAKGLVDPRYQQAALRNILLFDGWRVPEGETADHSYQPGMGHAGYGTTDPVHLATRNAWEKLVRDPAVRAQPLGEKLGFGHSFTDYFADHAYHPMFWQFGLKEAAKDDGIRTMARAFTEARAAGASAAEAMRSAVAADAEWLAGESEQARSIRHGLSLYDFDQPDYLSRLRARALRGLVIGHGTKTVDEALIARIANNDIPSFDELAQVPIESRPVVKGRVLEPLDGRMPTQLSQGVDRLWRPIHTYINFMSREPLFTALTADEYATLEPLVRSDKMSVAEAHSLAVNRAMYRMIPLIHNTMMRSQLHEMMRNIWPFFFAQEQAYKRWGYAALSNPASMTRAALLAHGFLGGLGSLETASNGNKYVVLPGVGSLGRLATQALGMLGIAPMGGVPSTMLGDLISLKSVFPEGAAGGDSGTLGAGPSVSPVIAVPLRELANLWDPAKPFIQKGIGQIAMQSPLEDELIPNATLRRAWDALGLQQTGAWVSTYNYVIQYNAYKSLQLMGQAEAIDARAGQVDQNGVPYGANQLDPRAAALMKQAATYFPLPTADVAERQAALGRMKMQTRILLLTKAAVGAFSPLSPTLEAGDFGLRTEVQNYVAKYGLQEGMQRFLDANPYATPYTVFQSTSSAGTDIPATTTALKWIEANRGFVQAHPQAAAMLLPQKPGAFDPNAYTEELTLGLRERRMPQDFMNAIYKAEGDREYIPSLNDYEKMRTTAAGNYSQSTMYAQQWAAYVSNLAARNPVWWAAEQDGSAWSDARQAYADLETAIRDNKAPKSPAVGVFKELDAGYKTYLDYLNYIRSIGSLGASAGITQSQLKNSFNAYLDEYVTAKPGSYPLAYGVFRRLVNEAPT